MQITKEQLKFLGSLSCTRLSSITYHKNLISGFENNRNPNLIEALRQSAWKEDEEGSTAYYLIKNSDDIPLFFFSLKCGALYQHLDEGQIKERKKAYDIAKRLITKPNNKEEEELASLLLEQFRSGKEISDEEIKKFLNFHVKKKQRILNYLLRDKSTDPNKHIIRVENTHSGIELVHFCANEKAKDIWHSYNFPQSLGKIVFWFHIVPLLQKVREAVGCKYLFLFAADGTEDGTLLNYYNVELKLNRPLDIGTSKPIYDFNCIFMCNEITALMSHRNDFFKNFNPDSLVEVE